MAYISLVLVSSFYSLQDRGKYLSKILASFAQIFRVLKLYGKFAVSLKMPASVLTGVELGDLGDSQVCGRRISVMPP